MLRRKVKPSRFDRYRESLRLNGFKNYDEYLQSPLWKAFNDWYRSSVLPQWCLVCRSRHFVLHHHNYSRVGFEDLWDVVPLCEQHHAELHKFLDSNGEGVADFLGHLVRCFSFSFRFAKNVMRPFEKMKTNVAKLSNKRLRPRKQKKITGQYPAPSRREKKIKIPSHALICPNCRVSRQKSSFVGELCSVCINRSKVANKKSLEWAIAENTERRLKRAVAVGYQRITTNDSSE